MATVQSFTKTYGTSYIACVQAGDVSVGRDGACRRRIESCLLTVIGLGRTRTPVEPGHWGMLFPISCMWPRVGNSGGMNEAHVSWLMVFMCVRSSRSIACRLMHSAFSVALYCT